MTTIKDGVPLLVSPEEARALWYDTRRWPAFVDGFKEVVSQDPSWPASGRVIWNSTPAGQGQTREVVADADTVEVETEDFRARRTVLFAEDGVRVTFDYALKRRDPWTPIVNALFIRRELRASLQRTLRRFAVEADAAHQL